MKIFFVLPLEIACWNKGTLMNDEVSESIDIIDVSFEVVILEWSFKCLRNALAVLNLGLASFPIHSGRRPNALFSNTPLSLRTGDDGGAVGRIHCDMAFEDPLEYPVLGGQREHSLGRLRVPSCANLVKVQNLNTVSMDEGAVDGTIPCPGAFSIRPIQSTEIR